MRDEASLSRRSRILGSLLGGAIGDALGAAIEFDSLDEIRAAHGPSGLTVYAPAYGRIGALTDDTQMTLFTAEGLIRSHDAVASGAVDRVVGAVHDSYLRWLETQGGTQSSSTARGWLIENPVLHKRRAPGNTCMSALTSGKCGTPAHPINNSKGCGGVMRVAPVGLVARGRRTYDLGVACAAITHGHPTGYVASGAFAMIIGELTAGESLIDAVAVARDELPQHPGHEETLHALDAAIALAREGEPTPERIESLGGAWIGEEALAIGVYCSLMEHDTRDALVLAVNHSGDSDSTGSVVGNLMGAMHAADALPADLLAGLEARDVIEQIANDLADTFVEGATPDPERYPPC